jgi:hypothetical protein
MPLLELMTRFAKASRELGQPRRSEKHGQRKDEQEDYLRTLDETHHLHWEQSP